MKMHVVCIDKALLCLPRSGHLLSVHDFATVAIYSFLHLINLGSFGLLCFLFKSVYSLSLCHRDLLRRLLEFCQVLWSTYGQDTVLKIGRDTIKVDVGIHGETWEN